MGRFALLGAAVAAMIGLDLTIAADRVGAMGFCNCCEAALTSSCSRICSASGLAPGMCPAIVDYEGTGAAAQGANPLNGMSFKELALGGPTPWQLELFRRYLEAGRKQGVTSYNTAMRQLKLRKISAGDFDKITALYKEVLVNYYHGIRAYLIRVGRKAE